MPEMTHLNDKYGLWMSNNATFDNSYDAYLYATNKSSTVTFFYHHDVYNKFNITNLGKVNLNDLYRIRALRLRDKYDYLILYYSGGSDSHNVLRTFIDNNIALDEVCIKWPTALRNGLFYTPNTSDTSAKNYWSEWDYAVKPTLEWLAANYPRIKITFKDFIGDSATMDIDKMFEDTANHGFKTGIILNSLVSDSEPALISAGKTVGNIYGVDKPKLVVDDNGKVFMFFNDDSLRSCVRSKINPYGAECFYWDPEMPEISFEQAYKTAMHYNIKTSDRKLLISLSRYDKGYRNLSVNEALMLRYKIYMAYLAQDEICKECVYTTWDNRFQSNKPMKPSRRDKFYWFHESIELTRQHDIFQDNVTQRLTLINPAFYAKESFSNKEFTKDAKSASLQTTLSPLYYVTTLTNNLLP